LFQNQQQYFDSETKSSNQSTKRITSFETKGDEPLVSTAASIKEAV